VDKSREYAREWQASNSEKGRRSYQKRKYGAVLDDMTYKEANAVKRGILYGYRSGLEETVAKQIEEAGHPVVFEADKFSYTWPARNSKYTPDFRITRKDGSVFYVETKGRFETKDRQKHILLKETQNAPEIRFVFSRSKTKISKGSPTSYAKWCDDHGFQYSDKSIPDAWFNE
jgi:hypothetical protein